MKAEQEAIFDEEIFTLWGHWQQQGCNDLVFFMACVNLMDGTGLRVMPCDFMVNHNIER